MQLDRTRVNRRDNFVPRIIEFAFPPGDDYGCQTIADYVRCCARHIHQFVYAENQRYAFDGQIELGERSGQHNQRCAWYGGDAFGRKHQREQHCDLLPDGQRMIRGLRDEHRSER